jgi:phage terminase large subunit-like protein
MMRPAADDATTQYALDVVDDKIVAGPHVRAACARHLQDLERGSERGLFYDAAAAERIRGFFRDVLTVEIQEPSPDGGAVSRPVPFILLPEQCFITGCLFGWKNENGLRRFRRSYTESAKGSGKSPLGAGIGHYMCSALDMIRAECYTAATDQDQAAIPFRDAVAMWERSPGLQRKLEANGVMPVWQLTHKFNGSFYRPISSAKKGKSGIRPYYALIDEVHEHPDNSVIEMLRAGTKANEEALIFEITNSGFDKKSVCGREHDQSIRIVHGDETNDAWFSFVCSLDDGDEPFDDEACWPKANPSLGVTIKAQFIREQVAEAKGLPSKEGLVRRLHFCQWTESENSAIPRALWLKCEAPVDPAEMVRLGYRCIGGLDLSRVNDLSSFTLTWLPVEIKDQWRFISKTWFWTPKDTLAPRSKRDHAPYDVWAEQGHLEAVPGKILKFGWIADALLDLCARYHPEMIGCDEYGLKQLIEKLSEMGQTLPCVVHPQGFNKREIGTRREFENSGAEKIELWMPDSINKLEQIPVSGAVFLVPPIRGPPRGTKLSADSGSG